MPSRNEKVSSDSNGGISRYICSRCGGDCSGYTTIGNRPVCGDCFSLAVFAWLANQAGAVTTSGV